MLRARQYAVQRDTDEPPVAGRLQQWEEAWARYQQHPFCNRRVFMEGPTSEPMWGPWCPAQGLAWSGPPARLRASGLGIQGSPREQLLIPLPVLAFQGGQGLGHPEQAGPSG